MGGTRRDVPGRSFFTSLCVPPWRAVMACSLFSPSCSLAARRSLLRRACFCAGDSAGAAPVLVAAEDGSAMSGYSIGMDGRSERLRGWGTGAVSRCLPVPPWMVFVMRASPGPLCTNPFADRSFSVAETTIHRSLQDRSHNRTPMHMLSNRDQNWLSPPSCQASIRLRFDGPHAPCSTSPRNPDMIPFAASFTYS